jgi:hypothetical protein
MRAPLYEEGVRHPDRSRFSGGGKDLAWSECEALRARSLAPLVKARGFGMTPLLSFEISCDRKEKIQWQGAQKVLPRKPRASG